MMKKKKDYQLRISRMWIGMALILASLTSFLTGCAFRAFVLVRTTTTTTTNTERSSIDMPPPVLDTSKQMPYTMYTEKQYDVAKPIRNSHHLHIISTPEGGSTTTSTSTTGEQTTKECEVAQSTMTTSSSSNNNNNNEEDDSEEEEEEEEHLPAGQHLLVDIKNVDSTFLDSEQQLAQAMVDIVNFSKLTMLSYHCHSLLPSGVSCVGVLLESHISFHTWPKEGVITLDLFTCGSGLLIPLMPIIEQYFAIPQPFAGTYRRPNNNNEEQESLTEQDYIHKPKVIWKHTLRGFRPRLASNGFRPLESDVGELSEDFGILYKKEVVSVSTPFQLIDIWDSLDGTQAQVEAYDRSLRTEIDTYESRHPEFFSPARSVFLEGVLQSSDKEDAPYHEALVHPAMFAFPYPGPANVAIIGGGEGATLREILKHKSVQKVKMIEIDQLMVETSKKYLPSWSDCSDIVGSAPSCFDDPRSDIMFEDALVWFINNGNRHNDDSIVEQTNKKDKDDDSSDDDDDDSSSSDDDDDKEKQTTKEQTPSSSSSSSSTVEKELFDVIVMDALDPQEIVEFAGKLYNDNIFAKALYDSLSDKGILVMQLGSSPDNLDPAEEMGMNEKRAQIMNLVQVVGFEQMFVYEESHCGFGDPWSFMVACKSDDCHHNWYNNQASVDIEVRSRMIPTKSGAPSLKYFDGATMASYQMPSKAWETVYCRKTPTPESCIYANGFDKKRSNTPIENFQVKISGYGVNSGRGVFATNDLVKGSYVSLETCVHRVYVNALSTYTIELYSDYFDNYRELEKFTNYMYGYGFETDSKGTENYVDASILTFVNHGCNSTHNVESSILDLKYDGIFDPASDRHLHHINNGFDIFNRDVKKGEEILSDYTGFTGASSEYLAEDHQEIADMCAGVIGQIKQVELDKANDNTHNE